MLKRSTDSIVYTYIVTFFFALFFALPIIWMISTAFKSQLEIFESPPILFVKPKLDNFRDVLLDQKFMRALRNSVFTAIGTVIFTVFIAVPASYGLSRLRGAAKTNILAWLLLTRSAPGMIYVIPYFIVYSRIGLIDTTLGLVIINLIFTIPLMIWLLLSFFEEIPASIEEAAFVDGASIFQVFTRIAIPLVRSGLSASAILVFIFSWNEFLFALIITRREAVTAPISIVNFMAYAGTEWGKVAAGGIFILLPVLIFSLIIRKYLVRGMAAGAVKE